MVQVFSRQRVDSYGTMETSESALTREDVSQGMGEEEAESIAVEIQNRQSAPRHGQDEFDQQRPGDNASQGVGDEEAQLIKIDVQSRRSVATHKHDDTAQLPRSDHESDKSHLAQVIRDVGVESFGIQAIEAWVLNNDRTRLVMPHGGWWRHPVYDGGSGGLEALKELEEKAPQPLMLGCGLAGNLWLETNEEVNRNALLWRHVNSILSDPDRPWDPRLSALVKAGLGLATAIRFNIEGTKGIVVFLARESASPDKLCRFPCEDFLRCSAKHIGAVIAISMSRKLIAEYKQQIRERVIRIARSKLRTALVLSRSRSNSSLKEGTERSASDEKTEMLFDFRRLAEVTKKKLHGALSFVWTKATLVRKKARGGSMKPPPPMSWKQTLWTFFGVSFTLLVLTMTSTAINTWSGGLYGIAFGPIGALMTLQFGLSAAPASQPRNIMYGQAISGTVSLLLTKALATMDAPLNIRITVATAAGIAAMCKLGFCHPPGGGFAIVLSTGKVGWVQFLLLLLASGIAVIMSTLINNLDENRQYPHYWNVEWPFSFRGNSCPPKSKGTQEKKNHL